MPEEVVVVTPANAPAATVAAPEPAPAAAAAPQPAPAPAAAPAVPEIRYDALDKTIEVAKQSPEAAKYIFDKLVGPELTKMKLDGARKDAMIEFQIDPATWQANAVLLEGDTPESIRLKAQAFSALRPTVVKAAGQAGSPGADTVSSPSGAGAQASPPAVDTTAVKPPTPDTVSPALPAAAVIPPANNGGGLTLEQLRDRALSRAQQEAS